MMLGKRNALIGLLTLVGLATVACGSSDTTDSGSTESPSGPAAPAAAGTPSAADPNANDLQPSPSESGIDVDPDKDADPNTFAPADDDGTPPATQTQLIARFAPHLQLHPTDWTRPANVDWFLARTTMRFNHADCPDHEVLALGKVTQASLIAQSHDDNKSFCLHDGGKVAKTTTSDHFFVQVSDHDTYKGAARADWKTYVVWRPHPSVGKVDIDYWFFYAYNDGFSVFNHEADWEHMTITIDPKGEGGQGTATNVFWSAHKGGTSLTAHDPKVVWEGGTHAVSYVASGSHANYVRPGSYAIPGTYIANDDAKASTVKWNVEDSLVFVGNRAAPKNNQIFIKYWGYWGAMGTLPETEGITRHFP